MVFNDKWETDIYSQKLQINRYPFDEVVSTVMRLFANTERSKVNVLELGCGTGNNLAFLAREGFNVFGVDGSQSAVDTANIFLKTQNLKANIRCLDFNDLSTYESNSFDFVLDRGSITHNPRSSIINIITQVKRILKSNGHFLSIIFSDSHSGCRFGIKQNDGTYSNFSHGYLKGFDFPFYFASRDDLLEFYDNNFKVINKIHQVKTDIMSDDDVRAMWFILAQKYI